MPGRWLLAACASLLAGAAVAWALTGMPGAPAACPPAGCDCEAAGPGPMAQPANAWSSLALAGAGIGFALARPPRRRTGRFAAGALVIAGTSAFLFHAGLTAWAARLDGIAVGVLVAALAAHRWWPGTTRPPRRRPSLRSLLPWALLASGAACWSLGRSGEPWCRPESLLQAHAAWHLLAAAAISLWLSRHWQGGGASPISPQPLASGPEGQAP